MQQARDVRVAQWLGRRTGDSMVASLIPSRRAVVLFAYEGRGGPVVARMNAERENSGSNLTAGSCVYHVTNSHAHAPPLFRPRLQCSWYSSEDDSQYTSPSKDTVKTSNSNIFLEGVLRRLAPTPEACGVLKPACRALKLGRGSERRKK